MPDFAQSFRHFLLIAVIGRVSFSLADSLPTAYSEIARKDIQRETPTGAVLFLSPGCSFCRVQLKEFACWAEKSAPKGPRIYVAVHPKLKKARKLRLKGNFADFIWLNYDEALSKWPQRSPTVLVWKSGSELIKASGLLSCERLVNLPSEPTSS